MAHKVRYSRRGRISPLQDAREGLESCLEHIMTWQGHLTTARKAIAGWKARARYYRRELARLENPKAMVS